MSDLQKKTVLLGVTGGIAAYKSADLVSRLRKQGLRVLCILSRHAAEFVSPLTFEVLSGNPVAVDMFERRQSWEVEHISWAQQADLFLVAPASANFIAKYTHGIADDMLTTTAMACRAPMLIAPAMNTAMYESAATQQNLELLRGRGVHFIGPEGGLLACGDVGAGRMSEPAQIVEEALSLLTTDKPLLGKVIMVSAGPTREYIDPVRYLTNRSSGKMGYALAAQALRMGAAVKLISGPVSLKPPTGVEFYQVESTKELYDRSVDIFPFCDAAIMAAAPADYYVKHRHSEKLKKTGQPLSVELDENPDVAATLGQMKRESQKLVIFVAETNDIIKNARAKLRSKNADFAVANDVTQEGAGFDVDTNIVNIVAKTGSKPLPLMSKDEVARKILERLSAGWNA
ncbi:MAG: bifunctional phosphopantothenoylcysteine decarboxylase/phosphopantothenate--cysteine ligase CoaBC [Eubacteriales bacterium]|nr:bifunctional phosphopantothenoylcysteine decarboxylase/phosphopantothenate--cysteine ligase CoaBC [Eubacteriales bacterium]